MVWLNIIYLAASTAFIQVGAFVGLTLLIFGIIDYKTRGGFLNGFRKYKNLQVLFGALMGLTPGCGGAIMVMPLYLKGHASFGTMVATLISTMGDAAFVLLVEDPISLAWVLLISFIVAIIMGYTLDYFKAGDKFAPIYTTEQLAHDHWQFRPEQTEFLDETIILQTHIDPTDHIVLEKRFLLPNLPKILYYFRHHGAHYIFWAILVLALPLGIMNLMQIDFDTVFIVKNLGFIGAIGTLFSIIYTLMCRKFLADDNLPVEYSKLKSLKETFIHNAEETAFVIMWVFIALLFYESAIYLIGGEEIIANFMKQTGYIVVLMSLVVGLIPGCAPHIILATMYVQGIIPFSALITNAICNDGDALFPMLAMDKRSSLWATIFGVIPAWIVGTVLFIIGL
ncbi:MAG: putative manganese transporter [Brevinema sp.]